MNENLHDIDKLFRDGIEGHEEAVPPAVWEGVSNDLDKKQASYYKDKYNRLRRWGLLFLLVGFLTTAYVIIKIVGNDETKMAKTQTTPAAPDANSNERNDSTDTKQNNNENSNNDYTNKRNPSNEPNNEIDKVEDENTVMTSVDTAITFNDMPANTNKKRDDIVLKENKKNIQSITVDAEKKNETLVKEKVAAKNSSIIPSSTVSKKKDKSEKQIIAKQSPLIKNKIGSTVPLPVYSKPVVEQTKSASVNLLAGTNRNLPFIVLSPLQTDAKTILSETKTVLSKPKATPAHRFSLTAFASPNFSFDRLEDDKRFSGPGRNRRDAHKEESHNVSFSGGLLLNYGLSQGLILQSGVTVTSSTTSIAPKTIYAKAGNNGRARYELYCSSGYSYIATKNGVQPAVGDSAKTSGSKSSLTYVSIPASLSLQINKGRFSFYPGFGAGLNFLTSGKTETELAGESSVGDISGLKSSYLDGRISLGAEYSLTPKISIGLRPTARIALTPINKETPVKSYQNYINIETGLRIKL